VGFSDHVCLKPASWAISPVDLPVMTEQILKLRDKYSSEIKVRYGAEVDYFPGKEEEINELIKNLPLDYVIGSVHFIGDWNFDTDLSLYGKWPNDELYHMYYELIQLAAKSGLYDIIGHLDIIKKFRVYPESDQTRLIDDTLNVIKKKDLVVELNTGGLDRPCAEMNPSPAIAERCYHHGIPMTISSDAHQANQVARHFETAENLMKRIGFEEIATFENRVRKMSRL
jgi:histidinol-phosphatase (PHP family)